MKRVELSNRLVTDLGYHSLAMTELAFSLEALFSLDELVMEQVTRIQTVGDIVEWLTTALDDGKAKMPSPGDLADFAEEYGWAVDDD